MSGSKGCFVYDCPAYLISALMFCIKIKKFKKLYDRVDEIYEKFVIENRTRKKNGENTEDEMQIVFEKSDEGRQMAVSLGEALQSLMFDCGYLLSDIKSSLE